MRCVNRSTEVAKVTNILEFINLSKSSFEWSENILKKLRNDRDQHLTEILNSGYDIKKEVEKLEDYYFTSEV